MHKTLLAFVVASLIALGVTGVPAQTVDFETVPVGTTWQNPPDIPGDVVLTQNNIAMSVEEFFVNGVNTFGVARIVPGGDPFAPSGTHALHTNTINVKFDFAALPPVVLAHFEYVDLGGIKNFQINNTPLQEIPNLNAIVSPAGFTVVVTANNVTVESVGGTPITSLLIGGQEDSV
ncbi:MAG: hypothetical protein ETSY2_19995 [Candidatus Entotheonella gemina]|uniref:PEP-CTERM sorting domain-containing protein n=1 Tax=Candidatus Entotheonella gemina TaxID=1429439 RepID=W4M6X4_9BACT|nr:MAG: hypothetical protein ETSY2_19995 [Candidatus Entotheonella gemina]